MLVRERKFNDYYFYRGDAYFSQIEFRTLRIPWIWDRFVDFLEQRTFEELRAQQAIPIWSQIFRTTNLLEYKYTLKFWWHFSSSSSSPAIPPVVWVILRKILYAAAIFLGIWLVKGLVTDVKEVVWGPPEIPEIIRVGIPLGIAVFLIGFGVSYILREIRR